MSCKHGPKISFNSQLNFQVSIGTCSALLTGLSMAPSSPPCNFGWDNNLHGLVLVKTRIIHKEIHQGGPYLPWTPFFLMHFFLGISSHFRIASRLSRTGVIIPNLDMNSADCHGHLSGTSEMTGSSTKYFPRA